MSVVALSDAADEPETISRRTPTHAPGRTSQAMGRKGVARLGVLQDTTESANRQQGACKATSVIAQLTTYSSAWAASPVPPPPLARWMSYDSPRPIIEPGVSGDVPRIDVRTVEVGPLIADKQRRDHAQP
jgi:hypothetical protein